MGKFKREGSNYICKPEAAGNRRGLSLIKQHIEYFCTF